MLLDVLVLVDVEVDVLEDVDVVVVVGMQGAHVALDVQDTPQL